MWKMAGLLVGITLTHVALAGDTDWAERARQVSEQRLRLTAEPSSLSAPISTNSDRDALRFAPTAPTLCLVADTDISNGAPASQPSASQPALVETEAASTTTRGPLPGFWETLTRDVREAPGLLWNDTKKVYGNPYNLVFLVGAGGASLALRPEVDDDIEDHYDRHHSFKEDWRDAFGAAGNPITHFALAGGWYLVGQQLQEVKTYEVGKRLFSALIINGVTTSALKLAACTESPNGENWAWPSGHVSSSMVFATVLNDAYGPMVGLPLFGLTGLVAVERLDSGEHHFSDVAFGAALGWVVAETVMKEHRPEIFGGELVPYADPARAGAGVCWIKTLGS